MKQIAGVPVTACHIWRHSWVSRATQPGRKCRDCAASGPSDVPYNAPAVHPRPSCPTHPYPHNRHRKPWPKDQRLVGSMPICWSCGIHQNVRGREALVSWLRDISLASTRGPFAKHSSSRKNIARQGTDYRKFQSSACPAQGLSSAPRESL